MVARQVGEHCGVEAHCIDSILGERVRRDFHAEVAQAHRVQVRQLAVHADAVGRGVRGGLECN